MIFSETPWCVAEECCFKGGPPTEQCQMLRACGCKVDRHPEHAGLLERAFPVPDLVMRSEDEPGSTSGS